MIGHSFTYGTLYIIQTEQSHVWLLKGFFFFLMDRSSVAEEMTACAVASLTSFVMPHY